MSESNRQCGKQPDSESQTTTILGDDLILAKRDVDAFNAGIDAGIEWARDVLQDALGALDLYSDVEDGGDGRPVPNRAMTVRESLREILGGGK